MISRSIFLACERERAFELFTTEISSWWPAARRHTGDPGSSITLSSDGSFYEVATDGRRVELGRVTAWTAPDLLVLDFFPGTGPDFPTEATITFTTVEGGTLVRVNHGPKPGSRHLFHGVAPRYESSWELVLDALRHASEHSSHW